jgi:2-isopropylmalate synthase
VEKLLSSNEEEGEHSPVHVMVEFRDGEQLFTTTGVSRNSIEAGWMCVVDAFEYKLQRDRFCRG